ncbi:MAG: hypothetical protein ABSC21_01785 [Terriglobia bacterium]
MSRRRTVFDAQTSGLAAQELTKDNDSLREAKPPIFPANIKVYVLSPLVSPRLRQMIFQFNSTFSIRPGKVTYGFRSSP